MWYLFYAVQVPNALRRALSFRKKKIFGDLCIDASEFHIIWPINDLCYLWRCFLWLLVVIFGSGASMCTALRVFNYKNI